MKILFDSNAVISIFCFTYVQIKSVFFYNEVYSRAFKIAYRLYHFRGRISTLTLVDSKKT